MNIEHTTTRTRYRTEKVAAATNLPIFTKKRPGSNSGPSKIEREFSFTFRIY